MIKKVNNIYAVGIDIGGTNIKYGIVNSLGKIIEKESVSFNKNNPKNNLDLICKNIKNLLKKNKINPIGVGIGMPGICEDGKLIFSANLRKWEGINILSYIHKNLNIKTYLTNDAKAAALGEVTFGSAKGFKNAIMLTLGTGVGGGIILNNKLYEGREGQDAELGHMSIDYNGIKCGCGRRGCLEAYASAVALTKQTIEEMKKNKKSIMWKLVNNDLNKVDASIPFIAEKKGDKSAKKIIDNYVFYLGQGLLNYCNIFRPDVIILGGGVAKQGKNLTDKLNKYLKDNNYGIKLTKEVKVITAKLGYDTGLIGAASLVFNNLLN